MSEQGTGRAGMDDASLRRRATEASAGICGWKPERVEVMPAHASPRRYVRCSGRGERRVVMLLPPAGADASEAGAAGIGRVADEPFLRVGQVLQERAIRVPVIHGHDEEQRAIVLEDAGDVDFDRWATSGHRTLEAAYGVGLEALLEFTRKLNEGGAPAVLCERRFTPELLRWELDHYVEWRLAADLGITLDERWRTEVEEAFDALVEELVSLPQVAVHRDFQSHNLMVVERDGTSDIVVLDFQDALLGPLPYDAVAFLRDSYVTLPEPLFEELVERWARGVLDAGLAEGLGEQELARAFHLQTLQRKLKDAGRFVYIDRVRGNPAFLQWIPSSMNAVAGALERVGNPFGLGELLSRVDPFVKREVR